MSEDGTNIQKRASDSSLDSTEENKKYIVEMKDSQDLKRLTDTEESLNVFITADESVDDRKSLKSSSSSTSSSYVLPSRPYTFELCSSAPNPHAIQMIPSSQGHLRSYPTVPAPWYTLDRSQIQQRALNPDVNQHYYPLQHHWLSYPAVRRLKCTLDNMEPDPSNFRKEPKPAGTTEGAEPQSASQVTEDVMFHSAFDLETEYHRSQFMSSSTISVPVWHGASYPITSTLSSSSISSASEKIKTGSAGADDAHQIPLQKVEPLFMFEDFYRDMSLHLTKESNMAAWRTEACWSPEREHYHPGSVSEFNTTNESGRAASLPNIKFQSSFEEFTPDFTDDDEGDEAYRFWCSGPGLYQCRETGLVFVMEAEGEVIYRTLPWNRRSLSQQHKKPAGPLFDITCLEQSVGQLHLPHCEVRSTGAGDRLSVAHVNHEGMEFIRPERITETHVVIKITGLSAFGNIKDEDSPPDPVRALVLLFYKPPAEPEADYQINVLLLPNNVPLREVLRFRKRLDRGEIFLETPPHCKLQPQQVYTLSTGSEQDMVLVQPKEAEFDSESYDNYLPTFQLIYEKLMKHMTLFLKDSSSTSVWDRRVCLTSSGANRSCGSTRQNLPPDELLLEIRSSFIDGVSGPVLQCLLDKLLERKVLIDSEREAAEEERSRRNKARFIIDIVRRKGQAAGSEMIQFLCELDPFLSEHLGLM